MPVKDTIAKYLPFALLVVAAAIFGAWALVAKAAIQRGADPFVFAFYRAAGGTVVLSAVLLFNKDLTPGGKGVFGMPVFPRSTLLRFFGLGLAMTANITGLIISVKFLSALTVSVFQPTIPVVTFIVSVILGIEEMSVLKLCSIAMSVVGAGIVITMGETHQVGAAGNMSGALIGAGFLLMNVTGTSLYFIFAKEVLQTYAPVFVTTCSYIVTSCIMFTCALVSQGANTFEWKLHSDPTLWLCAAYAIFLQTALNYSILAWVNKRTTPTVGTCFTPMQPVCATLFSWAFLDIIPTLMQLVGGVIIVTGLMFYVKAQADDEEAKALLEAKVAQPNEGKKDVC